MNPRDRVIAAVEGMLDEARRLPLRIATVEDAVASLRGLYDRRDDMASAIESYLRNAAKGAR